MANKVYPDGAGITALDAADLDANDFVFMGCSIAGAAQKTQYTELALAFGGSRRNLLINANPAVNQRAYVSGAATSTGNEYTLDRWRVVTSGQNLSWSDSEGKRTMTAPAGGLEQVIEGTWLQSGTYVISWEGTATCTVGGTARTNGESFSVTGGSNLSVIFSGGTLANPQLEIGEVPTLFDWRHYDLEFVLCCRYIRKVGSGLFGYFRTTSAVRFLLPLSIPMRTSPTLTLLTASPVVYDVTAAGTKTGSSSSIQSSTITSNGLVVAIDGFTSATLNGLAWSSTENLLLLDAEIY